MTYSAGKRTVFRAGWVKALAVVAGISAGCSERQAPVSTVQITGAWALGPASGGVVGAYTLDADPALSGQLHSELVPVEHDGTFRLPVLVHGETDLRICVSPGGGARYEELGAGSVTTLKTVLCVNVGAVAGGEGTRSVHVTAMTTWAAALSDALVQQAGYSVREADRIARADIEAWLDCLDVGGLVDAMPFIPQEAAAPSVELDAALLAYVFMGGFGNMAAKASEALGARPGTLLFNTSDIIAAIAADLRDRQLDGLAPGGAPKLHDGYPWNIDRITADFVVAVHRFMLSENNVSGFLPEALRRHLQCLAATSLFGDAVLEIRQPQPPTVVFRSPADGDVLSEDREVVAEATAEDPIEAVTLSAERQDLTLELAPRLLPTAEGGVQARATLPIADIGDSGSVTIRAKATTDVGHVSEAVVGVATNTSGPSLSLNIDGTRALAEAPVEGLTQFRGVVYDASGIARVTLTLPVQGAVGSETGGAVHDIVAVDVDTAGWADGEHEITLEAVDVFGADARITETVLVDNNAEGVVNVTVSLAAAVRDAMVVAAEMPTRMELGRGGTDENGRATVQLADPGVDFAGYVEVSVTGGTTRDLIDDSDLIMQPADVLKSVVPYEPSAQGTVLNGVQVNAVTTCAAQLGDVFVNIGKRESLAANLDYAYRLFGDHLHRAHSPDGPLDIRTVAPVDLDTDWSSASASRRRVSLVHAGLAWDAARHAWEQGRDRREYSLLTHLRRLCGEDLLSGKLSGFDVAGDPVRTVGDGVLTAQSFRHDLAAAIFHWLNGRLPDGEPLNQNRTALRGEDFAQRGDTPWGTTDGFLHLLTNNTSELFPSEVQPVALDVEPPSVTLVVDDARVARPDVRAGVRVSDGESGSGIASVVLTVGGVEVYRNTAVTRNEMWVDVTLPCNAGFVDIVATVVDHMALQARDSARVMCDNLPPNVMLKLGSVVAAQDTETAVAGSITLRATANDPSNIAELVVVPPAGHVLRTGADELDVVVDTTDWPEGLQYVVVTATDRLGNSAPRSYPVRVDNYRPGHLDLHVSLGSPVRGATVTAKETLSGGVLGSGITDDAGNVAIEVLDTSLDHGGYIDVHVSGGEVASLLGGAPLALRTGDRLRALFPYAPTADGTHVEGANVNLVTTCASELSDVYIRTGRKPSRSESIEYAYYLFGDHLSRANSEMGGLDARWVAPSDMTTDWSANAPLRRRLGLLHAGVAWDASRHTTAAGRDAREYTILDHMNRLCRRDLSSGHFSGRDESGVAVVTVGGGTLSPDSFRFDAAFGAFKWLDGQLPSGEPMAVNVTDLRGADFAQVGEPPFGPGAGFFHTLSGTTNDLFLAVATPQLFDAQPPVLRVWAPGSEVNTADVELRIHAHDGEHGTGVASLTVTVDGVVAEEVFDVPSEVFWQPVSIPCNRDGIRIVVAATDGVGLHAQRSLEIACDDRPPAGGFSASEFVQEFFMSAEYSATGDAITYVRISDTSAWYQLDPSARVPSEPIVITKFWDRLHSWSENLPVLKLWFSDTTRPGYATPDPELRVTYEYIVRLAGRGLAAVHRQETPLPYPGAQEFYHLPISYETLSHSMRLSSPDDEHIIRFRARDRVGNLTVIDYPFHLVLRSAPVWYGGCRITPTVTAKTLASDATHELDGGNLDIGEGFVSYAVHSTALDEPLSVRVVGPPEFDITPTELRWERDLGRKYKLDEYANCSPEDFSVFWTFDRALRGAMRCDPEHMGYGPRVNSVVEAGSAYAALYRWWDFQSYPVVGIFDNSSVRLPQHESSSSTFLANVPNKALPLRVNSGSTETVLDGEAYGWDQYEITNADGSDIETKRYYFAAGYINISRTDTPYTESKQAYIYLSGLRVSLKFPTLEASHPELPHVVIPVLTAPECTTATLDWEERIGYRW